MEQPAKDPAEKPGTGHAAHVSILMQPSKITRILSRLRATLWPAQNRSRKLIVVGVVALVVVLAGGITFAAFRAGQNQKTAAPTGISNQPSTPIGEAGVDTTVPPATTEAPKSETPVPVPVTPPAAKTPTGGSPAGGSTGGSGSGDSSGGGSSGGGSAPSGCALPLYPRPSCTGVPSGVSLAQVNGDVFLSTPGEVYENKRVTGTIYVRANNVIIRNSEVYEGVTGYSAGQNYSFSISDSTIGAPSGCNSEIAIGSSKYTATRVHIRNFGDGFRDSGNDILVQDSYVKLCSVPGDHSDGFQGYQGGTNVRLIHTTIDQRDADDVTAPLFIADQSPGIIATDNLLMGGGFTVRIHGTTQSTFSNNRIVQGAWVFGPVNSDCGNITWSDNTLVNIDSNYNVTGTVGSLGCS